MPSRLLMLMPLVLTVVMASPMVGDASQVRFHGCGPLVIPGRPWKDTVPGSGTQSDDRWVLGARGTHSDCPWARKAATRVILGAPWTPTGPRAKDRGGTAERVPGGTCAIRWLGPHGEEMHPFAMANCTIRRTIHGRGFRDELEIVVGTYQPTG